MRGYVALLLAVLTSSARAKFLRVAAGGGSREGRETCSPLKNHGSFSTIEVEIGTPGQKFDLVADTGSNSLIVQSCVCQDTGACPKSFGKCFRGSNKSSSFLMKNEKHIHGHKEPEAVLITFGSGQIAAYIATDKVQVGSETAEMDDGLLLMVKQALTLTGEFEGILGLGRPEAGISDNFSHDDATISQVPGFMEKAGIDRFSMCFNYQGDGVLGLNTGAQDEPMASVGQMHWGLDFQGVSVGDAGAQQVLFCDPSTKKPEQETACGIIPDSGTTMMMGPKNHIVKLYEDLCAQWPRCKEAHEGLKRELKQLQREENVSAGLVLAQLQGQPTQKKLEDFLKKLQDVLGGGEGDYGDYGGYGGGDDYGSQVDPDSLQMSETFQLLLENCGQWLANASIDAEMPKLKFHVAGAGSGAKTLEMRPESFILETTQVLAHREIKKLMGIFPVEVLTTKKETVCMPAFAPMDYPTKLNGDVWIMGTPLFYEYDVHYDRAPEVPTMQFTSLVDDSCGTCKGGSITKKSAALLGAGSRRSVLRRLDTEPVVREVDQTLPF